MELIYSRLDCRMTSDGEMCLERIRSSLTPQRLPIRSPLSANGK